MSLACLFCNTRCRHQAYNDAYYCTSCNVEYCGTTDMLSCIRFRTMIKDIRYELIIDIQENSTRLAYWDEYKGPTFGGIEPDILKTITEFKPVMNGVTPQNVNDKIKTLLVFS